MESRIIVCLIWLFACLPGCAEDTQDETVRETGYQRCTVGDAACPGALACTTGNAAPECVPIAGPACEDDPCSCFGEAVCGAAGCTSFGSDLICGDEDNAPFANTALPRGALTFALMRVSVCDLNVAEAIYGFFEVADDSGEVLSPVEEQEIQCIVASEDCGAVAVCLGFENPCDPEVDDAVCMGSVHRRCTRVAEVDGVVQHRWRAVDCADDVDGNTRCTDADGCQALEAECAAGSGCRDGVVLDCSPEDGYAKRTDCQRAGLVCREQDGVGQCIVADSGCVPCDGQFAQFCEGDAVISRNDCAALGLTCNSDGGSGFCEPEQSVCQNRDSRCEGTVARVCNNGVWFEFDCARADGQCTVVDDAEQQLVGCN